VVAGDSLAHGAGDEAGRTLAQHVDEELARLGLAHDAVIDLAVNGSRTADVERVIGTPAARAVLQRADVIVMSIGGNDLYGDPLARALSRALPGMMMRAVESRVARIVRHLERQSDARIVLLSLYDPYRNPLLDSDVNVWTARLFERFHEDRRVQVITIADLFIARDRLSAIDHFHPGAIANACIARRIAEAL